MNVRRFCAVLMFGAIVAEAVISNAQEATPPAEWQTANLPTLANLAREQVARGEPGKQDCARLASYVAKRFATEAASGNIRWSQWLDLTRTLGEHFSAVDRGAIAKSIQQSLIPDPAKTARLDYRSLSAVSETLISLGQLQASKAAWTWWVDGSVAWQSLPSVAIANPVGGMDPSEEFGKSARLKVVAILKARYLTSPEATSQVTILSWSQMTPVLLKELPVEERTRWAQSLRKAFEIGVRSQQAYDRLLATVRLLDVEQAAAVPRYLGEKPADSADATGMIALANSLARDKDQAGLRRLSDRVEKELMTNPGAIRSVGLAGWRELTAPLVQSLTDNEKADWAERLRAAFVEDAEGLRALNRGAILILDDVLRRFGEESRGNSESVVRVWLEQPEVWDSVDPEAFAELSWRVAVHPHPELVRTASQKWVGKLQWALAARPKTRAYTIRMMLDLLREIQPSEAAKQAAAWLAAEQWDLWGEAGPTDLLLILTMARADQAMVSDRVRQFDSIWVEQYRRDPGFTWFSCMEIARESQNFGDREMARRWGMRAWLRMMESPKASVNPQSISRLSDAFGQLGLGGEIKGADLSLLTARIQATAEEDRQEVWQYGLQQLAAGKPLSLSEAEIATVKEFLGNLGQEGSLTPMRVLEDLLTRVDDQFAAAPFIRRELCAYQVVAEAAKGPQELRGLVASAQADRAQGKLAEAARLYSQVVTQYLSQPKVVELARRNLVPILLSLSPADIETAEQHLKALAAGQAELDSDLWNLECRAFLRRVAAGGQGTRPALWEQGLGRLAQPRVCMSQEAMADLDALIESARAEDAALADRMLADMMLLGPDLPTMGRLQVRRAIAFARRKDWPNAKSAAVSATLLACYAPEGPRPTLIAILDAMKKEGLATEEAARFEAATRLSLAGQDSTGIMPKSLVDSVLVSRAGETLGSIGEGQTTAGRRLALLRLWAGAVDDAMRELHSLLAEEAVDTARLTYSVNDLSIALAVADASMSSQDLFIRCLANPLRHAGEAVPGSHSLSLLLAAETRFASPTTASAPSSRGATYGQIAGDERAKLAANLAARWDLRWLQWGGLSFQKDDKSWAMAFWKHVLDAQEESERATAAVSWIADYVGPEKAISVLTELTESVQSPVSRRSLMLKAAAIHYEASRFVECLACLDSADQANPKNSQTDISASQMRAMCLVRTGDTQKALELLTAMSSWPGAEEGRAEAGYLIGWLQLREGDNEHALPALRQVIEKYPKTPSAAKAQELLQRVAGS